MDELFQNINAVKDLNLVVVGDIILDKYIQGATERISPEAPVPILLSQKTSYVLGGAANVATNLGSMGAKCTLVGIVGDDKHGEQVKQLLKNHTSITPSLLTLNRVTTTKTRLVSKGQQLLRVDEEQTTPVGTDIEREIVHRLEKLHKSEGIDGLVLQDYNKGVFTKSLIAELIQFTDVHKIPVFVDPKHHNFWEYKNVTLFKPNLSEVVKAQSGNGSSTLDEILLHTSATLSCSILMCTMAEKGIAIVSDNSLQKVPTQKIDVVDVSGAGDTALAAMVIGYLMGLSVQKIAVLANLAGMLVCMKSGVTTVSLEEIKNAYHHSPFNK